ncbi:MAG: 23S rRNA (uracil(1939)-C(5))-methyltransferase RlmD [Acetilactobacillus jinshanensis]
MPEIEIGTQFKTTTRSGFDRMGVNGESVGYFNRKLAFIAGALPNETVIAKVTRIYRNYLRARAVKIVKASPLRVKPVDAYANQVGGFELENMKYSAQLQFKKALMRQSLKQYRPRGFKQYNVHKTMGMNKPYGYRNKLQFPVRKVNGKVIAGLYQSRSHHLVDLKTCSVQYPVTMKVVRGLVKILQKMNYPIYDPDNNSGIIKTLVVRAALHTHDVQVTFITNTPKLIDKSPLLNAIQVYLPEVTSIMQNVNPGNTSMIWGDRTIPLAGHPSITEKMGGLAFKLSARAFLQLNSYMMPQLYEVVKHALNLKHGDHLVDAYSGVGTMGLPLARQVKELRGMDTIPEAVEDANANAKMNHIQNARYYVGPAEDLLPKWIQAGWKPDALIVDPPRVGLARPLIKAILAAHPQKFVYVSCNPATLARDLVTLTQKYRVNWLQPIDMMPQTARCEVVASFSLRNNL